jgi:hypothetical protein
MVTQQMQGLDGGDHFTYDLPLGHSKPHSSDFRVKANTLGRAELLAWVAPLVTQLTEF